MKIVLDKYNCKLIHGDCLQVISTYCESMFAMVFADPPYNLSNGGITCSSGKMVSVNKGEWDKSSGFFNDFSFTECWTEACKQILLPYGTLWITGTYHNIYTCGFVLQSSGWHILNEIIWYKSSAPPNLSCRMFTASHESLIWAKQSPISKHQFNYELMKMSPWVKDSLKVENKQMRSVWHISPPLKEEKKYGKHPTQKPLALLERIILSCTNPGDWILDPFCGSGTTGVAALSHGRNFVGIDSDLNYLKSLAAPRLKKYF